MKSLWSNFIIGAFFAILLGIAFNFMPENVNASDSAEATDKEKAEDYDTSKIEEVAMALKQKEKDLKETETRLKEWQERLVLQEESVKERVAEFKLLTEKNEAFRIEQEKRQKVVEERLKKTFETMKPKKAAEVLAVMEEDLAVELLLTLKAKNLASILDKMDSNKAMMLSSKLAELRKPASSEKRK